MLKNITKYNLEFVEEIKMRQLIEVEKVEKQKELWLTEIEALSMLLSILLISIDGNTDKSTFKDFILDNFWIDELSECSTIVMEIMGKSEKKSQTLSTNTNSSSWTESENSPQNG